MGGLFFRVSIGLLLGLGFFTGNGDGLSQFSSKILPRPATAVKEGVCLGYAVKYFNMTIAFHEKLHMNTTPYFNDEVIHKEVPHVRDAINCLDSKLHDFLKNMKTWDRSIDATGGTGSDLPLDVFNRFVEELKMKHKELWENHGDFNTTKLSEAKGRLKSAKLSLMKAIHEFTVLGKRYVACAPDLLKAGIPLARDHHHVKNSKKVSFPFDVSVLSELETYYTEVGSIEDQVSSITTKYYGDNAKNDTIPDPKDVMILNRGRSRLLVLNVEIKRVISSNERMLSLFNEIVQVSLNKFPAKCEEICRSLDQTERELLIAEGQIEKADSRIKAFLENPKDYYGLDDVKTRDRVSSYMTTLFNALLEISLRLTCLIMIIITLASIVRLFVMCIQ